jgi:hypothetical protein
MAGVHHGASAEPPSDEMLARGLLHMRVINQYDPEGSPLPAPIAALVGDYVFVPGPSRDRALLERPSSSPSGTIEEMRRLGFLDDEFPLDKHYATDERTRITAQRPTERDVTSLDFERERANNIGKSDMNGSSPTVLRGPRGWKR